VPYLVAFATTHEVRQASFVVANAQFVRSSVDAYRSLSGVAAIQQSREMGPHPLRVVVPLAPVVVVSVHHAVGAPDVVVVPHDGLYAQEVVCHNHHVQVVVVCHVV